MTKSKIMYIALLSLCSISFVFFSVQLFVSTTYTRILLKDIENTYGYGGKTILSTDKALGVDTVKLIMDSVSYMKTDRRLYNTEIAYIGSSLDDTENSFYFLFANGLIIIVLSFFSGKFRTKTID